MSFEAVAALATDDHIVLICLSPARNWNEVIHGQLLHREAPAAVVAQAFSELLSPPQTLAHFASL